MVPALCQCITDVIFEGDARLGAVLDAAGILRLEDARYDRLVASCRRQQFATALRLPRVVAPEAHEVIDAARARVGLTCAVDLLCSRHEADLATMVPPSEGVATLVVAPTLVQDFEQDELAFVVGHELGHLLFEHARRGIQKDPSAVPRRWASRSFALSRYQELSADRVGLLCAGSIDAALRAMFKISTGLRQPPSAQEILASMPSLEELEPQSLESLNIDWFTTHPYGPLRIQALEVFARSARYERLLGQAPESMGDDELRKATELIMEVVDPVAYNPRFGKAVKRFLGIACAMVMRADGQVHPHELTSMPDAIDVEHAVLGHGIVNQGAKSARAELRMSGLTVALDLSPIHRLKLLDELTTVALADGSACPEEMDVLLECAKVLKLDANLTAPVLARLTTKNE